MAEGARLYRAAFENAAVGIRVADVARGGSIVQANAAMHRLLGYADGELLGKTIFEIVHPEDRERNLSLYDQVVAGGLASYQLENRYLRRDGDLLWGLLTAS